MMLTDSIAIGGAEKLVVDLAESLDPSRFRTTVCLTRAITTYDRANQSLSWRRRDQLRAAGVEVLELGRRSRANATAWARLLRFMHTEDVAVIHAHKFGSNFWGAVTGALGRTPVVLAHEHSWSFEGQQMRQLVDRLVISRLADAVIAVSRADRQRMIDVVGIPPERIVFIPNGIPAPVRGDPHAVRRSTGISETAPVLVSVGNLLPAKAYDVMLQALALVRPSFPEVRLLVAGGRDPRQLQRLAAQLGIEDAVTFLGLRTDIPDVLAAANIAVSSSDHEGSPLAAMEYLGAGLPVIATAVGGMPDLITSGETGILVQRRDPSALASAIQQLLANPDQARAMGEQGRIRQRRDFSLDAMVARVETLYTDLLEANLTRG
jgi:glycosyltransferase involved in cell wall biosynthesis